ncbi:MgtC/SapB family protein [Rivibacter subsaxonicus]|uniref:Uncharacterized membrane protein (DUF4010 family) n=1 Tax=Rivibacter subsaxonicus TaxID=457575 RepID=A0A4Q7W1Z5_9BURK|nr:DUF4010 domain-containing protein [Rivibacter subsaxonicus]RZU02579.1 uncharacterized membrane protein (DUF4010 family) [Rivibacter subsaxonicus]
MSELQAAWVGLAVALGCGLLIGIERERRKGQGDDRAAAGVRSFAVAALAGALAQSLASPWLVAVGALLVAALGVVAYLRSRSRDPGITTELALFCTYLVGVLSAQAPALGAACGVVLAVLLSARRRLHRFATEWLSEQELHDALLLAALALVVLPLIPPGPAPWLGGMAPRPLLAMVLLILGLQAAGHVALRAFGPRAGAALSGFAGGFVSSTATVASCGARVRADPAQARALAGSAGLSGVATWLQALLMTAALAPAAAAALAPVVVAAVVASLACSLLFWRSGAAAGPSPAAASGSALRPREALAVALLLLGVSAVVGLAHEHFGDAGLWLGVATAALADAHAPVVSLASLQAAGRLDGGQFVSGVLLAIGVNTLTRLGVALVSGGPRFALRVGWVLCGGLAAAWGARHWLS